MRHIKYFILACIFIVLGSFYVYGEEPDSGTQTIRVVMDDNYPPYSFRNSEGKLQGITIDQWALFEKKTGLHVEISGMNWNSAYESMKNGKFDVIDTISYNEERTKFYDFTKPYATIDVPIFFQKNISGISNIESLKGFTIAAKKGDNSIYILNQNGIDNSNIKVYQSAEEVVRAAKNKEAVIFVLGKPPALYYLYKMGIEGDFNYSTSLYTSQFYRAVKKGNTGLLKTINHGFAKISKKEYEIIDKKWLGISTASQYNAKIWKPLLILVTIISIFILTLLIWNNLLRSKVAEKTWELSMSLNELQQSKSRINALLQAIPDMFFMFDNNGTILDYHATDLNSLYLQPTEFLNKNIKEIFEPGLCDAFKEVINKSYQTNELQTLEYELPINHVNTFFEARFINSENDQIVSIIRNITDRKKAEEKLIEIGIHDALTGLYNRYYFEKVLLEINCSSKENLFIGMFDLDGLKLINDTLGHEKGDAYLIATAQIIKRAFPEPCIISRIGGDEFCIIQKNTTEEQIAFNRDRFSEEIEKYNKEARIIPISISHGYIFDQTGTQNVFEMVKHADNRMYREKLHRRQSIKSEVVQTMKKMLEARDFITDGHASRMENLAEKLAAAIGLHEKDILDIKLLAQFHDIGKVGIPDQILSKPGKLTPEEYEIMKRHTDIGHRIAESSIDLLPIAEFILKHHEFWNGQGYPFGLKGNEIPLECRILSIVDAYDAMTNDRPYRMALSKEAAIEELKRCSGSQFDPDLVNTFIEIVLTGSFERFGMDKALNIV